MTTDAELEPTEAEAWAAAEAAYRDTYADAHWRTVARDDGAELAAGIPVEGPFTDYAGNLVDAAGNPYAFEPEEVTAKAKPKPKASRSSSRPRTKK